MTKTSRDSASATEAAFHKHYAAIWGEERWHRSLFPALAAPTRQVALLNSYVQPFQFQDQLKGSYELEQIAFPTPTGHSLSCYAHKLNQEVENVEQVHDTKSDVYLPQPLRAPNHAGLKPLLTHWNLDAASVLATTVLNVQLREDVLDLCAAPGGKSVTLAQIMAGRAADLNTPGSPNKVGRLVSNEADGTRYRRLAENLKAYIPAEMFESKNVLGLNIDATDPLAARKLSLGDKCYDKVLVDAPCSSERHIIHAHLTAKAGHRTAVEMANWRPGSSKKLAKTQVNLLMTGLRSVRVGGNVLYATCSIEPTENDGVIEKTLAIVAKEVKKGQKWQVEVGFGGVDWVQVERDLESHWAERTTYGWIVLPDHPNGGKWGPLFFTVLTKVGAAM